MRILGSIVAPMHRQPGTLERESCEHRICLQVSRLTGLQDWLPQHFYSLA